MVGRPFHVSEEAPMGLPAWGLDDTPTSAPFRKGTEAPSPPEPPPQPGSPGAQHLPLGELEEHLLNQGSDPGIGGPHAGA